MKPPPSRVRSPLRPACTPASRRAPPPSPRLADFALVYELVNPLVTRKLWGGTLFPVQVANPVNRQTDEHRFLMYALALNSAAFSWPVLVGRSGDLGY
jgi:hypothetical protein